MLISLPVVASCVKLTLYDFPLCFTTISTILSEKSTFQQFLKLHNFPINQKIITIIQKIKTNIIFICNLYHTITKKKKKRHLIIIRDCTLTRTCNDVLTSFNRTRSLWTVYSVYSLQNCSPV